ncbi:hypothetical protein BBJ28_00014892 [Nothophytophthora sp. Chile5]|nr:hypothetical protein BBJ28_00014892 [Nothophytophthora sp. Chile5]
MKRLAEVPITAFFARKQPRRPSFDSQETESVDSEEGEAADQQKQPPPPLQTARGGRAHREAREDVLGILQRRELVGCATTRQLHGAAVAGPRRRRRQELVRWALTRLERLPVELQLAPHWERQAGALRNEAFYASCMEFDAQGVILAVGASNGIIALFDFDDVFHRSLNAEQTAHARLNEGAEQAEETKPAIEILHPLHTIFTPFEVKRIRWNPLNQVAHAFLVISIDEIACSFSNRNEIHLFNLRKFPSKPHRVLKSSSHPSSGYNDLLFLPAPAATGALRTRRPVGANAKPRPRTCTIIAGDMDGAIRMWDPRFPMRPMWSFPAGKQPINALVLSPSKQFLVCGTEAGVLMVRSRAIPCSIDVDLTDCGLLVLFVW